MNLLTFALGFACGVAAVLVPLLFPDETDRKRRAFGR